MTASSFAATLRHLRESFEWTDPQGYECTGMTQAELGEMVGVSQQAVNHWEMGRAIPSMRNLIRTAAVLNVPPSALLISPE